MLGLQLRVCNRRIFFFISKHMLNRLNETVLLSTQNIYIKLWLRKYLQVDAENLNLCERVLFLALVAIFSVVNLV